MANPIGLLCSRQQYYTEIMPCYMTCRAFFLPCAECPELRRPSIRTGLSGLITSRSRFNISRGARCRPSLICLTALRLRPNVFWRYPRSCNSGEFGGLGLDLDQTLPISWVTFRRMASLSTCGSRPDPNLLTQSNLPLITKFPQSSSRALLFKTLVFTHCQPCHCQRCSLCTIFTMRH